MAKQRYIFVTGGVVSSLGKGICAASVAALLKAHGFKVRIRKLDPYLNVDPGTMNPLQHGEVFVTDDGAETDLDLGHYERFTDVNTKKLDNITSGRIYSKLLKKERKGDYLGGTVQVIPHVTDLIKEFIYSDLTDEDFVIYEIGGTVGDIEGLPFFEAIRQVGNEVGRENALFMHVTLVPYIKAAKELKTKPTQHSVKELRSIGIQPDILVCRSERKIPESEKKKIALFCNVKEQNVIEGLDVKSIYEAPLKFREEYIDRRVLEHFNITDYPKADISTWLDLNKKIKNLSEEVTISIVGKYTGLKESYKSIIESLDHAGFENGVKVNINWVNSRTLKLENIEQLKESKAILVPGGFGENGIDGKILAIKYARENKIPFLGICLGMQLSILEFARNVVGFNKAYSSELTKKPGKDAEQLIGLMTEWESNGKKEKRDSDSDLGGTMRLGAYPCNLRKGSLAERIYGKAEISERHRHRYEVNVSYKDKLEEKGLIFSGMSPDGKLPEIIELQDHPFFITVQFHPEFKTRPFNAHPLFKAFVGAAK
jgi:CTP synthase